MFKDFKTWLKREKYQISLTVLAAIIPVVFSVILNNNPKSADETTYPPICNASKQERVVFFIKQHTLSPTENYAIQVLFVFSSLFILIYNKRKTYKDLEDGHSIKTYLIRKCHIKITDNNTVDRKFETIKDVTEQFFRVWIFVWMLWLALYLGLFVFSIVETDYSSKLNAIQFIYKQIFDFLTSSTVFIIYLVLTNVTVNLKRRKRYDESIWWGAIGWIFCFVIFIVCLCLESVVLTCKETRIFTSLFLSVLSAFSFLLVLGKMNSLYLQIPQIFLVFLYIYGLNQCYVPLNDFFLFFNDIFSTNCGCLKLFETEINNVFEYLNFIIPYITLIGKVVLMLTLCWIVDNKRFIYYIIHQTVLLEQTPTLLRELNRR